MAEAALAAGERACGTARRTHRFDSLTRAYPDTFLAVEHDVCDTSAAASVVDQAVQRFGQVDVLVNNAGAGQVGSAEEVSHDQLHAMITQHLLGPAALVRAVLPAMRERGQGAIVQMSSQGGRMSFAAVGSYSAGKFALEGWSEALAAEVTPFGIRVLIVEPSRFRTGFNDPDVLRTIPSQPAYRTTLAAVRRDMTSSGGAQEGDPARAAAAIREALVAQDPPLRLALGVDAVHNLTASYEASLQEVRRWADLSRSADYPDAPRIQRSIR